MTNPEIALYLIAGLVSVILAAWSISRKRDNRPELFKGYVLLSLTCAGMFLLILRRAWSSEGLAPSQLVFAALAAGLFSTAAALVARQAYNARRDAREPPS